MAKKIIFLDPTDKILFTLHDHTVDVCKSHTVIYGKSLFSLFRIFDTIDNFDIDLNRIRVNYSTGESLLIYP